MHDSLHLRNVSKLPVSLRSLFFRAQSFTSIGLVAAKGSLEDLATVYEALIGDHHLRTSSSALYALPILYLNLDPTKIPSPHALDAIATAGCLPPAIDAASLALKALHGLVAVKLVPVEVDAILDLWPRIWPWMQFLHTYWECLPTLCSDRQVEAFLIHYRLVLKLRRGSRARRIISTQPGLRFVFTRAWTAVLLDHDGALEQSHVLRHSFALVEILTDGDRLEDGLNIPKNFEEVVNGAGSLDRLADAVLKQLSIGITSRTWDYPEKQPLALANVTFFMDVDPGRGRDWLSLLLSRGVVSLIVSALRLAETLAGTMALTLSGKTSAFIKSCLVLLCRCVRVPPLYPWVAEAIEAGLMRVLVHGASQASGISAQVEFIIRQVLPGSLVSRAVLVQMKKALLDVREISGRRRFKESSCFKFWEQLVALANSRIAILNAWEAAGRPSYLVCGNISCGRTGLKGPFKRCSRCWSANYCSSDCQSVDWRDGHRAVCEDLRAEQCVNPEIVPERELSFMRALVHFDYEQHWFDIAMDEIKLMRNHPSEEFYIIFDYMQLSGVMPVMQNRTTLPEHGVSVNATVEAEWLRFAKSDGRMRMHAMRVAEGFDTRLRIFPSRGGSALFHQGLIKIAELDPLGRGMTHIEAERHDEECIRIVVKQVEPQFLGVH
ncbi:hypothetical protein DFH06DRAFT_1297745 [Mycena polygramma]|nr:hypothetical protein DFH06DRAFT_1297745 [Mycena polygramma]